MKLRALIVTALCSVAFANVGAHNCLAQTATKPASIVKISAPFPKHVFLDPGATLEITGKSSDPNEEILAWVQRNLMTIAQAQSYDRWTIKLPTSLIPGRSHLMLRVRSRAGITVSDIFTEVLTEAPFSIKAPLADSTIKAGAPLEVAPVGTLKPTAYDVLLDGKVVQHLDATGTGKFSFTEAAPGDHLLAFRAILDQDTFDTAPINIKLSGMVVLQQFAPGGTLLQSEDDHQAEVRVTADPSIKSVQYYADDQLVSDSSQAPFTIKLQTDILRPGPHVLLAKGLDGTGATHVSQQIPFTVVKTGLIDLQSYLEAILESVDRAFDNAATSIDWMTRYGPEDIGSQAVASFKAATADSAQSGAAIKVVAKLKKSDFEILQVKPVEFQNSSADISSFVSTVYAALSQLSSATKEIGDVIYRQDHLRKINAENNGRPLYRMKLEYDKGKYVRFWLILSASPTIDSSYRFGISAYRNAMAKFADAELALQRIEKRNQITRGRHKGVFGPEANDQMTLLLGRLQLGKNQLDETN